MGSMSTEPTVTPIGSPTTTTVDEDGANALVRVVWWPFIGWWANVDTGPPLRLGPR
jgi:hypothetical protein